MERLIGTVCKLRREEGWGLLKVKGRPNHRFSLAAAPEGLDMLDAVWFTSYPKKPGQHYYNAGQLEVIRNPEKAA